MTESKKTKTCKNAFKTCLNTPCYFCANNRQQFFMLLWSAEEYEME